MVVSDKRQTAARDEGRLAKRKRVTRAKLLKAAYEVMTDGGVDAAKIKDITDLADVGFGTFYNYFETKDDLARQVLDCMIDDCGRRNTIATSVIRENDLALVLPVSTRLFMQEAIKTPLWRWWASRPDLLVDRMRVGFEPFVQRDMLNGIERGIFKVSANDVGSMWVLMCWMMVGAIHDVVSGRREADCDVVVVEAIVRMLGTDPAEAHRISTARLPRFPLPDIDWTFEFAPAR